MQRPSGRQRHLSCVRSANPTERNFQTRISYSLHTPPVTVTHLRDPECHSRGPAGSRRPAGEAPGSPASGSVMGGDRGREPRGREGGGGGGSAPTNKQFGGVCSCQITALHGAQSSSKLLQLCTDWVLSHPLTVSMSKYSARGLGLGIAC